MATRMTVEHERGGDVVRTMNGNVLYCTPKVAVRLEYAPGSEAAALAALDLLVRRARADVEAAR